jgi:predicted  nucleic acid-binding Zn-ribbon protein
MQANLHHLVKLQSVELRIAALEAEIVALPKKMAAQDAKLAEAKAALVRVETALKDEEKARRRMEDDIRDHRDKAAKYRAQTNNVKTNEQLHALQHEIAFAEKSIGEIEDRELASMEKTEQLEADRTAAQEALKAQTDAVEWEKAAAMKVSARDQEELKKMRAERAELRATADADLLSDYDRLVRGKKTAMAEVRDRQCQACHMGLRPAQFDQLRGGAVMHCESCGRLWYIDDGNDAKLAAKEAGQWDLP